MIKLKLIELTLAIYAFITVIILIHSTTLHATYYPLSTYYNFPPHLIIIPFSPTYLMAVSMYVGMYVWIDGCMFVCMYMYVCVYVCMYACMYMCMYVCMYMCVCVYVCMYV